MREYVLNFFIWYYFIKFRDYLWYVRYVFTYLMIRTNALPMIKYIRYPMFGDYSRMGRVIGPVIRATWAFFGSVISLVVITPFLIVIPIIFFLPFFPVIQLFFRFVW